MELPVKKLLMGADPARVLNRDAMANAESIDEFVEFARRRAAGQGAQDAGRDVESDALRAPSRRS
jgi:hypothetical protein